jgi:hypothetical protein
MRYIALIVALGFTMSGIGTIPLEAASRNSNTASVRRVKVKRNKVNGRRAPRRVKRSRSKVN